jgi:hypothetical protein
MKKSRNPIFAKVMAIPSHITPKSGNVVAVLSLLSAAAAEVALPKGSASAAKLTAATAQPPR